MDPRLLGFYERELKHVRELGGEFAQRFPKVAGRLGLDSFGCADPYVERMIEAFAFLTARIQLKLHAEQAEFTQHLLQLLHPAYLAPTPSMAVVQFQPNPREGSLASGVLLPRGTSLRSALGEQQTACEYRTAHPVTLWPIEIESVDYRVQAGEFIDVERTGFGNAKAALRIVLRATRGASFDKLPLDTLPLFLRGGDIVASHLYEQLLGANIGMVVQSSAPPHASVHVEHAPCVMPMGFDEDEALLPTGSRCFEGQRLLHEFFAFPERFMFAQLRGLRRPLSAISGTKVEIVLLFDRADPRLDGVVKAMHLALHCAPAINLFPRTSDRIFLNTRDHEFRIVPDRARALDFEVHTVVDVHGYGLDRDDACEFLPLYAASAQARGEPSPARYTVRREPRSVATGWVERGHDPRSPYVPSDVFLSTVDGAHGAFRPSLRQLAVSTLCTNRALPLTLQIGTGSTDFREQSGAPVESVRCVAGPTPPRSSPVHGDLAWSLLSHLSLDYLTICGRGEAGAKGLQDMLSLYATFGDVSNQTQVSGVYDVQTMGVVRPVPCPGPLTFGRGTEITVSCDEAAFQGTGAFLLGSVLHHFFTKYASINAFVETVLRTKQRGEVKRWPAMPGRRSAV